MKQQKQRLMKRQPKKAAKSNPTPAFQVYKREGQMPSRFAFCQPATLWLSLVNFAMDIVSSVMTKDRGNGHATICWSG